MWDALLEAGRATACCPCGLSARDTLRLEAGMALYGHEIDRETTPYEAGLAWVVKLQAGDFIGRDALVQQKETASAASWSASRSPARALPARATTCFRRRDGGHVCSGTWSPTFEKALGTAYVPPRLAEPGTELEIQVRKRTVPAQVVDLPFYRRG